MIVGPGSNVGAFFVRLRIRRVGPITGKDKFSRKTRKEKKERLISWLSRR